MEQALQEEQQRAIFDNSPSAIFAKDLQGRYIPLNRQTEKWTGSEQGNNGVFYDGMKSGLRSKD